VLQGISAKFATGLLRDPPPEIQTELYQLLQECAYPGPDTLSFIVRSKASTESGRKLRELLKQSIKNTDYLKFLGVPNSDNNKGTT